MVLEKILESSLDCKEIQPVHSKGDQPWDFFGRNDAKGETPVLWPPHAKSWLIGKDSNAGRDWGQEEKGTTEDEMAGWHHRLDGGEFEWTPGDGDGQGGLACSDSWSHKELDMTSYWTELNWRDKLGWYHSFHPLPALTVDNGVDEAVCWHKAMTMWMKTMSRESKRFSFSEGNATSWPKTRSLPPFKLTIWEN